MISPTRTLNTFLCFALSPNCTKLSYSTSLC
uniref:Uncharacterized protein n=1 Tax=Arundo donax TaxID=35708 RepID=A0A0A9HV74_ARUDO